jgi:GT2 family glycosyltransferase
VSIVLYKTSWEQLDKCIQSIRKFSGSTKIILIDNSPKSELGEHFHLIDDDSIGYIFNPSNPGYGAGHNIAIRSIMDEGSSYHLVINADVYFGPGVLETLLDYLDRSPDVGHVMPKVLYPNGKTQYLCKLLPTPIDLFGRVFLPRHLCDRNNFTFEMRWTGYEKEMFVPYLSGCFMLLRVDALRKYGLFDERFFMYPEDIDLTRRIAIGYRTMFYPAVSIYHEHGADSKKSIKMFVIHALNIIKYFNKWGWVIDPERRRLNNIAKLG